ncbi:hypothetical protein BCR44DRAFT_1423495 [Catenaria anguillulae PL171]|uniref:TM7S3/TM198-like domain-containing protein n=1 Tax=Catenaria anguillulae PL171 TaxID=765915 RepID=A0A1Y2I195_9FUNG|nr:hypothetical protein BCR44DRAFT_1423495 [Catenaria anguillulae PL171]
MAILGGLAVLYVEAHAVRIATSIGGSYLTILGIDVFAKTGFAAAARHFIANPSRDFVASNSVYGMIAANVVLAVVGIWVQYKKTCPEYRGYRSVGK